MTTQRETLAVLEAALRGEAHVLEQWPHLLGQQLHHQCARRGESGGGAASLIESHLEGRTWIRQTACFGRPAPAGRWALGRGRDIVAARLTANGRIVALAAGRCVLWDVASGTLISEIETGGSACALGVAAPATLIAIGHKDGRCSIWDGASGSAGKAWQAHDAAIDAVAISEDLSIVATSAGDGFTKTLRLWNASTGEMVRERAIDDVKIVASMGPRLQQGGAGTVRGVAEAVRCVGLAVRGSSSLVLHAQPGRAAVWSWSSGEEVWSTERSPRWWGGGTVSYEDAIVSAQVLGDAERFSVIDASGMVSGPSVLERGPQLGSVACAVFSKDGQTYISMNTRHECRLGWYAADAWHEQRVDLGGPGLVDLSPDGRFVIAVADDRCSLFHAADLKGVSADLQIDGEVSGCVFDEGGAACTVAGYSDLVHADLEPPAIAWRVSVAEGAVSGIGRAAAGKVVAASSRNGAVFVARAGAPDDATTLDAADHELTCVAVSPHSRWIAAGTAYGSLLIWEPSQGESPAHVPVLEGAVTALAWIAGGIVAVAGEANDIHIIDLQRPRQRAQLHGHDAWISCLSGHPDRGVLLSGGLDGRICLWEPERSLHPATVWRDPIEPAALAWLSGARLMASVDARGVLRLRTEEGREAGLCVLEAPPAVLQSLDGRRFGYASRSGEVTLLTCEGLSTRE